MLRTKTKANDLELYDREGQNWWVPGSALSVLQSMNPPRFSFFDRYVQNWAGLKVLDVGCGGGFTCEFMAERGANVTGVDQSEPSIRSARKHAAENALAIEYFVGKGEKLPVADASFDLVTCVDVLEHLPDPGLVLREIRRALKPNGLFLFDTINRTFKSRVVMIWMLERILGEIPKGTHDWNLFIRPEELQNFLHESGFTEVELAGFEVAGIDKQTKKIKASIGDDLSVMYIGKARKAEKR